MSSALPASDLGDQTLAKLVPLLQAPLVQRDYHAEGAAFRRSIEDELAVLVRRARPLDGKPLRWRWLQV